MQIVKRCMPFFLLCIAVILYFPTVIFQNHTFFSSGLVLSDLFASNYPSKVLLHNSLLRGQGVPYWTDQIGDGYPFFAEGGLAAFYPLNQLFFNLHIPTMTAFNAVLIIQFIISAIGTYLYCRKSIQLSTSAATLSALAYTFCGYMLMRIQHTNIILVVSYFPLTLFLTDSILSLHTTAQKIRKALYLTVIGTVVYSTILSVGSLEFFYYIALSVMLYIIIRLIMEHHLLQKIGLKISVMAVIGILAIVLNSFQILSTIELSHFSQRQYGVSIQEAVAETWPLKYLSYFINPKAFQLYIDKLYIEDEGNIVNVKSLYTYIGLLPILFILSAIAMLFIKNLSSNLKKWTILFLIITIFTYVYAIGSSTAVYPLLREIVPGMKLFRNPLKLVFLLEFAVAVLAGIGMQHMLNILKQKKVSYLPFLFISIVLVTITYVDLWINNRPTQPTVSSEEWLETPDFANYLKEKIQEEENGSGYVAWRVYSNRSDILGDDRVLDFELQKDLKNILSQDFNMLYEIPVNKAYAGLTIRKHTKLNEQKSGIDLQKGEIHIPEQVKKSLDLQSVRYLISDIPLVHPDLQIARTYKFKKPYKHKVMNDINYIETDTAYLYENSTYLPRIRIVPSSSITSVKTGISEEDIYNQIMNKDFNPSTNTLIELDNANLGLTSNDSQELSTYTINSYTPQDMIATIHAPAPGYLVMSDVQYPGWHADIDGKSVEIFQANMAFRAIPVEQGEHTLRLFFEPTHKELGTMLAGIGAGITVILSVIAATLYLKRPRTIKTSENDII